MQHRIRTRLPLAIAAVAMALFTAGCTEGGVAAERGDVLPHCGGSRSGATAPSAEPRAALAGAVAHDSARSDDPMAVLLHTVADVPMPGGTGRFDYQSLDDASHRLYISHMGAGQVVVFDTRSRQVLATVGGLPRVTGVWVVPELHRLYASATGLHQVAIIDTRTLKVIARVGRIGFPDGIAYAPNANRIFVSDESGGGELVIDATGDSATSTIPLGGEAGNTIYDAGSGCILVAVQTRNQIVAIDPKSARIVGRYAFAGADHPHGMFVDAPRRLLFVANQGNATLSVIDLRTIRVAGRQPIGDDPDVLAFDPGWRRLYVASESGVVIAFDERDGNPVRLGSVTMPNAHTVAVSAGTHLVYLPLENIDGRPVLRIMRASPPAGGTP
jgi:DNA-binding beta-propeller fold protein YncE